MGSVLDVTVVNIGYRLITIKGYSLDFSDGSMLGSGMVYKADSDGHYGIVDRTADSDDLPKLLEDRGFAQVFFDYDRIGPFMANLDDGVELDAIYAYDAEKKRHKAKVPKHLRDKINSLPLEWSLRVESDDST